MNFFHHQLIRSNYIIIINFRNQHPQKILNDFKYLLKVKKFNFHNELHHSYFNNLRLSFIISLINVAAQSFNSCDLFKFSIIISALYYSWNQKLFSNELEALYVLKKVLQDF